MTNHIMKSQLYFDVVPCVGWAVEKITPDEKYQDFGQTKQHYTMNDNALAADFPAITVYNSLKGNKAFEQVKKIVSLKTLQSSNEKYYEMCGVAAKTMGIKEKYLSPEQELAQSISNIMENKEKYDGKPNMIQGYKAKGEYLHNMDAEKKKAYYSGSKMG